MLWSTTLRTRRATARLWTLLGPACAALVALACVEPPTASRDEGSAAAERSPDAPKRSATVPADGWNEAIAWRGLEEGLSEAQRSGRPVMMVVHTAWCSRCRALKTLFNRDDELVRLSEEFVMVHVDQDATPEATLYAPDGQYIPRVLFLDEAGAIDKQLQNPRRSARYRYFYTPQEDLVATMRKAIERHGERS